LHWIKEDEGCRDLGLTFKLIKDKSDFSQVLKKKKTMEVPILWLWEIKKENLVGFAFSLNQNKKFKIKSSKNDSKSLNYNFLGHFSCFCNPFP